MALARVSVLFAACLATASVGASVASAKTSAVRATSAKKTVRIAVLLGSTENTYDAGQLVGIKAAAAKFGGKIVSVFGANFDATTQQTQVQDAVTANKYDAFVIEPQEGNVLVPQVKQAIKAGIKVVCLQAPCGLNQTSTARQIPGYVTTIGISFKQNGTNIAQAMVSACAKLDPCNVAYEPGDLSYFGDVLRIKAINAYLKKYPHVKIVAQQAGSYEASAGRTAMQNMLQAHPDINVAASSGDQMTLGMQQAVKAAGLTGKVKLIGNGASTTGVAAVRHGQWFATVENLPYYEGYIGTEEAIKAATGTPISKIPAFIDELKYSPVGGSIIYKANASKFKAEWVG